MKFKTKHQPYEHLRKKWLAKHKEASHGFFSKHGHSFRHLAVGGLGSLVLLTTHGTPVTSHVMASETVEQHESITKREDGSLILKEGLESLVPPEVRKLHSEEEQAIESFLSDKLKMDVKAEIEGIRLNRNFGVIGGEQHLYRYPGDNLFKHSSSLSDWAMYGSSGIAPGLGAWGYFSPTAAEFSEEDKDKERYYLAIQTFLTPGFSENVDKYRDFFKHRKMVVVNPKTGQAVVAVIGDAGPAEWTGKHLGGSPEVMHELGLAKGMRKGPVLYFFIDDPENKIPLGPVRER